MCEAGVMTAGLIERARSGDEQAFAQLVEPHRREIRAHCYRSLGSVDDAEDALQETLLAAWRSLQTFNGRASIRTWLYRIATNTCLNTLRSANRRTAKVPPANPDIPEPTRLSSVAWLEPYPDALLEGLPDQALGPEARYAAHEAISLAFVTALQLLPPRQRAVLILRDVLGFRTREVADILDSTEGSVKSALRHARATLRRTLPDRREQYAPPPPHSQIEEAIVERLSRAYETGDVDAIIALLTDDASLSIPQTAHDYQGRELCGRFLKALAFRDHPTYRLVATRANGQPAFGIYLREPHAPLYHSNGLLVLTLAGDRISAMTRFGSSVLAHFGLPRTLPD
jgi:RNA polymerase sigma-70 factor (ECF subfamily)